MAMYQRKHGRVRAKGIASHLRDGAQLITGLSVENLSMGGAFIRTATPQPKGSAVVIDLVKPGMKRSIRLTGRVATAVLPGHAVATPHVPGMGIEFDPLPPDVAARLEELLLALAGSAEALEADAADPGDTVDSWAPRSPEPALALEPTAPPGATPLTVTVPESAKLMVQVRGLMMELGDWQEKVAQLEKENAVLKVEVARLSGWIEAHAGKPPTR